jgi:hypothetical protein
VSAKKGNLLAQYRSGVTTLSVFRNETQNGTVYHKLSLQRSYQDASGAWHRAEPQNLPLNRARTVTELLQQALDDAARQTVEFVGPETRIRRGHATEGSLTTPVLEVTYTYPSPQGPRDAKPVQIRQGLAPQALDCLRQALAGLDDQPQ